MEEQNVFIVAAAIGTDLKMVKIRVTGETTFDWIEAKYYQNFPSTCMIASTFNEVCFQGTSVTQTNYNVLLAASHRGIRYFYLIQTTILCMIPNMVP